MNRLLIVLVALLVLFVIPTASANVTMYFVPQDGSVSDGTTDVEVWANVTAPHTLRGGQVAVITNATCVNITDLVWDSSINQMNSDWKYGQGAHPCGADGYDWVVFDFNTPRPSGTITRLCNLTVHCNCSTCGYCISPLNFGWGASLQYCPIQIVEGLTNLHPDYTAYVNGTVACGTLPSAETFSKPLYEGWNLISLPLDPEDDTASAVLSGVFYDAVYRYNATATPKQFEGIESADAMDPGTGYFVHVTTDCTWTYDGTAYTSMDVPLEQGLNMVGWLNRSKGIGDALSSISGDYYYVARWNTSAQKFEVYNPAAPSTFNDFATMDRGTGYFISAKQECALYENC